MEWDPFQAEADMVLEIVDVAVGGELPLPDPDVEVAVGEAPERRRGGGDVQRQ